MASLLAILQDYRRSAIDRQAELAAEAEAAAEGIDDVADAEAAVTAALEASAAERAALVAKVTKLDGEITAETARRDAIKTAEPTPAPVLNVATDAAPTGDAPLTWDAINAMDVATYAKRRSEVFAFLEAQGKAAR